MHNHEYVLKKTPNKCLNFVAVFARLDSYNVCGTRTVNNDDDFDFVILLNCTQRRWQHTQVAFSQTLYIIV